MDFQRSAVLYDQYMLHVGGELDEEVVVKKTCSSRCKFFVVGKGVRTAPATYYLFLRINLCVGMFFLLSSRLRSLRGLCFVGLCTASCVLRLVHAVADDADCVCSVQDPRDMRKTHRSPYIMKWQKSQRSKLDAWQTLHTRCFYCTSWKALLNLTTCFPSAAGGGACHAEDEAGRPGNDIERLHAAAARRGCRVPNVRRRRALGVYSFSLIEHGVYFRFCCCQNARRLI